MSLSAVFAYTDVSVVAFDFEAVAFEALLVLSHIDCSICVSGYNVVGDRDGVYLEFG